MRNNYLDLLSKYHIDGAHPGGFELTKKLIASINISAQAKLIDLGCGTGQTLAYIAKTHPCILTGVDIDRNMLMQAMQKFRTQGLDIGLYHADVSKLPFYPDTFDIALSESVTIFTNIDSSLKEYHRILKKNGILAAVEMTASRTLTRNELDEIESVYGIEQVPTLDEWQKMLSQNGFSNIKNYKVSIFEKPKYYSPKMMYDFLPHLNIINRYSGVLGYRVYICECSK